MVAPLTSTLRGMPSEVVVDTDEGLKHDSAVNLDHVHLPIVHGTGFGGANPVRPPDHQIEELTNGFRTFIHVQPPQPKGDINPLWTMLGVRFHDREIVWQDWNPYKKVDQFRATPEFVFIGEGSGASEPFAASVE